MIHLLINQLKEKIIMTRFERFTLILFEIMKDWNRIAGEIMKCEGLKATHALYILTIYRFREGITAARLKEICQKDKAEISRSLTTLEEHGLLFKEEINHTRYNAKVKLTEKGKVLAERLNTIAHHAVDQASQDLNESEREIMYKCLNAIAENLRSITMEELLP